MGIRLDFVFNFVKLNDVYRARREWRQKVLGVCREGGRDHIVDCYQHRAR